MAKPQSYWGPPNGVHSKDYVLFMENPDPLKPAYMLESHTLDTPTQNLTDALLFKRTAVLNGRIVTKDIVGRSAEETSRDYPLGFPMGALDSPALNLARRGGCVADFYRVFLCPTNECYEHFWVLENGRMDPPVFGENPITVDDVVEIFETSTIHVEQEYLYLHLDAYVIHTVDLGLGTGTLRSVAACPGNCPDCGDCVNTIYVGGDDGGVGTETAYLAVSNDRGATWTEVDLDVLTGGDTTGMIINSISCYGDYIWAAMSDTAYGAAALGGVVFSTDGGTTWTVPATPAVAMFTTFMLNGVPYVAGLNGNIWKANDGINWEQVTQTVLTTEDLLGSAVDVDENVAYIVGTAGSAVVYDGTAIIDISAPLAALAVPPTVLFDAHVLERNRVQVSGATGFIAESRDGGTTWTALSVAASVGDVFALEGNAHRALASVDGNLYNRTIMTDWKYTQIGYKYNPSLAGDLVSLAKLEDQNYFVGVMTTGEIIMIRSCAPDYCADRALA